MPSLKGSTTEANLKRAFANESQAIRRYLFFARRADIEGHTEAADAFRTIAEGEASHAHGHMEFLAEVGAPVTGEPVGDPEASLKSALAGEIFVYEDAYPKMARAAREEGFGEIADWLEILAKAEESHATRFRKILDTLGQED